MYTCVEVCCLFASSLYSSFELVTQTMYFHFCLSLTVQTNLEQLQQINDTNKIFCSWARDKFLIISVKRFSEWELLGETGSLTLGVAKFYELILRFSIVKLLPGLEEWQNLWSHLTIASYHSLTHPKPGALLGQGSESVKCESTNKEKPWTVKVEISKSLEKVKGIKKPWKKWKRKYQEAIQKKSEKEIFHLVQQIGLLPRRFRVESFSWSVKASNICANCIPLRFVTSTSSSAGVKILRLVSKKMWISVFWCENHEFCVFFWCQKVCY